MSGSKLAGAATAVGPEMTLISNSIRAFSGHYQGNLVLVLHTLKTGRHTDIYRIHEDMHYKYTWTGMRKLAQVQD
jgi:hypothetical protein